MKRNKFNEKIIGETFAYSQRWNVVEVQAPKLREKFIGHEVTFKYQGMKVERTHKVANIGRLEFSQYLVLEVEPSELDLINHTEARIEVKKQMNIDLNERPQNFFVKLAYNEILYDYLLLDREHDLSKCDWISIGEKVCR